MSSRSKSTLPQENIGFHEVLLALLEPEDRTAFKRFGAKLYEWALESRPYVQRDEPAPGEESPLHQETAAALVDLMTARDYLCTIGKSVEDSALGVDDARLSLLCRDLLDPLDAIVDKLQEGLE